MKIFKPKITLDTIVKGCIKGNRFYQKKLYELFHGKMMGIAMRYSNNYEEARDVVNEGFMKVFKNLPKFKPTHSLECWIKRIIINTAIDHYRKNKKYNQQVELICATQQNRVEVDDNYIEHKLSADEIMKLVQALPPAYRTVFNLYVIEGYTHKEIANILNVSEGTSKSNLAKARKKLKKTIREILPEYQYAYSR